MDKKENILIVAKERYSECLSDDIKSRNREQKKPAGFVEIFEIEKDGSQKKLYEKSNLVVYQGREAVLSRTFNITNPSIGPTKDEFLCWFGLGDGGCNPGDPLDPIPPTNKDTDLVSSVAISTTDATCADFYDGAYHKHPFDSVEFLQDPDNDNSWIISRITITISSEDANGENLNEAGLFVAASDEGGYAGPFHLYARITFPTIVKSSSRQLLFVWYLYF